MFRRHRADDPPRPSLHDHIRARLDAAGRLAHPAQALPDQPTGEGAPPWAAGARDGVLGHHTRPGSGAGAGAVAVADRFVEAVRRPSRRTRRALYEAVRGDDVLPFLDALLADLAGRGVDAGAVHELGRWLAVTGADRGAVKVGLAVMGITGIGGDLDVVRTLGAHEEFTLYAAVALSNGLEEPESELWALADAVDGWGRIHCVERLAATEDEEIRAWILRRGFRTSVTNNYLALIAATTGGLLGALRSPPVDREVLTAAGDIFEALVEPGPAGTLDDYDDGVDAVEAYLEVLAGRAETLGDFHGVHAVRTFLTAASGWDERAGYGWTATRRQAFEVRCDEILGRARWSDVIAVGLLSDDRAEFLRAAQAARVRGIDTFDAHVARITADPLGGPWSSAWLQADGPRARQLADLAARLLPLDRIASGPADELGPGPERRPHLALDWSLHPLRDHPGVGGDLLLAALRSPVTRNRNLALDALAAWPRPQWPAGAADLVAAAALGDPHEHTREKAAGILAAPD